LTGSLEEQRTGHVDRKSCAAGNPVLAESVPVQRSLTFTFSAEPEVLSVVDHDLVAIIFYDIKFSRSFLEPHRHLYLA
jgi:hypothetical protein